MMADDSLLGDDDLLEESTLLDDELLDDALLDDENIVNSHSEIKDVSLSPEKNSKNESPIKTMNNDSESAKPSSSDEKMNSSLDENALDNVDNEEPLDYDDDLDDLDERRESKFSSERADSSKPTNINEILPQQKNSKPQSDESTATKSDSFRGRGGYRGRFNNNRGGYRGRGGFRGAAPFPFPPTADQLSMFNNGLAFPNMLGLGGIPISGLSLPFNPNVPPPTLPSQLEAANWNRRVEAFVRKTAESGALPLTRNRSYSGSSSCSTCSSKSRSRSPLPSRRNDNRKDRRSRTPEKRKPVDDTKATRECAEAIGLDEEYLKKVEEQKRMREELQRKKAQRFQDTRKSEEPEPKKRREKSPRHLREKSSSDRDSRRKQHHRHHHHRRHHSRGHRSSSLEKLAENALKSINQAVNPLSSTGFPPSSVLSNNSILPPMNVPPPPLPISSSHSIPTSTFLSQPNPTVQQPPVPAIRTVSTTVVGRPDQPQVVMQAPPPDAKEKKLKARLVVVVSNIRTLSNAFKRISLFASSVGDLKKVWQATDNDINIIFEKLEDAKKFLSQYHNYSVSNIRLVVALHKMYLNLETIQ